MCGICSESRLIGYVIDEFVHKKGFEEIKKEIGSLDLNAFLQETSYLAEALNESLSFLEKKYHITHYGNDIINSNTVVCRGIEILLTEGFNSAKYQEMLSHECYRWAIKQNCTPDRRNRFLNLNFSDPFAELYREETFLKDQWRNIFKDSEEFYRKSSQLLEFFIDWWFLGRDLKTNPVDFKGTFCNLNPRHEESLRLFHLIFPAVFLSVFHLSGKKNNALIWKMLASNPCYVSDFEVMDLWLIRKAVEITVSRLGVEEIFQYLKEINEKVYSQTIYSLLDYVNAKLGIKINVSSDDH
jgi:hypothetical protein